MIYTKEDFIKMRYNTYSLDYGSRLNFGDLKLYPIFKAKIKDVDSAILFKWISYMYDKHSPLTNITDIRKRAIIAAKECKFKKDNAGNYLIAYKRIMTYDRSIMLPLGKKILQYCRLQRDNMYTQLVVYQLRLQYNNETLSSPDTETSEVVSLIKAQAILTDTIDTLMTKFLNGDTNESTFSEVIDAIENENMEFTPEQILLNDEVRKSMHDFHPYGAHYRGKKYSAKDLDEDESAQLVKELNNDTEEARTHFKSLGIEVSSSK